jgi:glyoxylase-like metal-dependent hydrolase (beta-lactamase superfamily II)
MEFKLLQANNGDAIHLRTKDEKGRFYNILIDGGTVETYSYKNKKGKSEPGELKQLIEHIKKQNEFIDLLILTHVDDDHIGGILRWFEQDADVNFHNRLQKKIPSDRFKAKYIELETFGKVKQ